MVHTDFADGAKNISMKDVIKQAKFSLYYNYC